MIPGFYTPLAALLGLLAIPIIVFYFLKLRRPRIVVPSLVLWRQVVNDNRVNSPFQKFRKNLLLLLQLLLLLFLVLAAMQPYLRGSMDEKLRTPILIDVSASMAALDRPGGVTRLDEAKKHIEKMIDGLRNDQEVCLVTFAQHAKRVTGFTNNKRELLDALAKIRIEDTPADLEDAMRISQAMAQGTRFDNVTLLSDGNFPADVNFAMPFKLDFQKLPPAGNNYGITAFSARRSGRQEWDVLVKVDASPSAESAATVELWQDGKLVGSEHVVLRDDASERLVFHVSAGELSSLEARLKPDEFDSLASDNAAWLELSAGRSLFVFCPPSMIPFRQALAAIGGVRLFPEGKDDKAAAARDYDVVVTDRAEDLMLKAGNILRVGMIPDELKPFIAVDDKGTQVVDWVRSEPLLQHVDLRDVVLLDRPHWAEQAGEGDIEKLGYEVVMHGGQGPLVLRKREGPKLTYVMTFHSDRSSLPYRVAFPVMLSNLTQLAMRRAGLSEREGGRTGVLAEMAVDAGSEPPMMSGGTSGTGGDAGNTTGASGAAGADGAAKTAVIDAGRTGKNYEIKNPDGSSRRMQSDWRGLLFGVPAPMAGRYTIHGEGVDRSVGVSVLDERETKLAGVDTIRFQEVAVAAGASTRPPDRSLWTQLAWLGLIVLLVEWWWFQRRPRVRLAPA